MLCRKGFSERFVGKHLSTAFCKKNFLLTVQHDGSTNAHYFTQNVFAHLTWFVSTFSRAYVVGSGALYGHVLCFQKLHLRYRYTTTHLFILSYAHVYKRVKLLIRQECPNYSKESTATSDDNAVLEETLLVLLDSLPSRNSIHTNTKT